MAATAWTFRAFWWFALLVTFTSGCDSSKEVTPGGRPSSAPSSPAPSTTQRENVLPPSRGPLSRRALGGTCPGDAVAQCVAKRTKSRLSSKDIEKLGREVIEECFSTRDTRLLWDQGACLPLDVGVDRRNGRNIELRYHCSDVCPDQGGVGIFYAGVAKEDCCSIGGYPRFDPAWGGYRGCTPPEVPLPRINYRRPDGRLEPATRSPCDPTRIVFEDGTVVIEPERERQR
jgi:hypothetical protein